MSHDQTIYYDGAARPRSEVVRRIADDLAASLARIVVDFEACSRPWEALIEGLAVPEGLDDDDLGTFYRGSTVSVPADGELVVSISSRLPRRLAATYEAVRARPWCARAELHPGEIRIQLGRLDPASEAEIAHRIAARAQEALRAIERSVEALLAVVQPDVVPGADARRAEALAAVGRIEAAKLASLRALRRA